MSDIKITRARLVPMEGNDRSTEDKWIPVQFNPNSLRITYANTLAAERSSGPTNSPPAQYIDKTESSLSVQLIYDTTISGPLNSEFLWPLQKANSSTPGSTTAAGDSNAESHKANSDVRILTKRITDAFINKDNAPESEGHKVPRRCQFEWGAFIFKGMISSYNETLDFFSPEGIPLRATVALTLKEDSYQFETANQTAAKRAEPTFSSANSTSGVAQAAAANKKNPKNWRDMALLNGIEDVRAIGLDAIAIPQIGLEDLASRSGSQATGFSVGASASLGSNIPGAFKWK